MNKREELVESIKEYVLENFDRLSKEPLIGHKMRNYTKEDVEERFGVALNIAQWEVELTDNTTNPLLDEYYNVKTELDEYVKEINETLYPNRRDLTKDLYINNKLRIEGWNDIKNMILFRSLEDFLDNQIKIKHELADRFVESIKTNIEDYTLFEEIAINQYNRILDTNGVKVENFGKNIEEEIKKEVKKLKKDENGLKPINFDYKVNPKTNLVSLQLSPSQYGASIQVSKSNYDNLHLNINSLMNKLTPYHIEVSGELSKDIVGDIMKHSNYMMNVVAFNKSNSNEVKHVKELLHFEVNEKIEEINNLKNKGKELGLLKEELYLNKELKEELIKIRKEEGKKAKRSRDNDER